MKRNQNNDQEASLPDGWEEQGEAQLATVEQAIDVPGGLMPVSEHSTTTATYTPPQYGESSLRLPPDLPPEQWKAVGKTLGHMDKCLMWWIGDWATYEEHRYGQRAAQAAQTGIKLQTLKNAAWVARKFEPSRRRDDLRFGHHEVVAAMTPEKADALLAKAAAEKMSVSVLKDFLKESREVVADSAVYPVLFAHLSPKWAPWPMRRSVKLPSAVNSVLFIWTDDTVVAEALQVMKGWGFTHAESACLRNAQTAEGEFFRRQHTWLLVGQRGVAPQPSPEHRPSSVIDLQPGVTIYDLLDEMYPNLLKAVIGSEAPNEGWVGIRVGSPGVTAPVAEASDPIDHSEGCAVGQISAPDKEVSGEFKGAVTLGSETTETTPKASWGEEHYTSTDNKFLHKAPKKRPLSSVRLPPDAYVQDQSQEATG